MNLDECSSDKVVTQKWLYTMRQEWRTSETKVILEWQKGDQFQRVIDEWRMIDTKETQECDMSDAWVTQEWLKSDKRVIYDRPLSDATVTHWSWKDAY